MWQTGTNSNCFAFNNACKRRDFLINSSGDFVIIEIQPEFVRARLFGTLVRSHSGNELEVGSKDAIWQPRD